jgi:FtsH-binding integral membrane protein
MSTLVHKGYLAGEDTNALLRGVYNWMMIGLLISGLTAYSVSHSPQILHILFGNPYMIWVLFGIELGLVVAISVAIKKISVDGARILFLLFSFIDGLTLASIFLVYTETSIATTFFIASATFGVMSVYGYFTDSDLSSWGKYLFIGLIGVIIAIVVNFFLQSSQFEFWVSIIGIFLFVGLTAYDTQKIKEISEQMAAEGDVNVAKMAIIGALTLYLDLINLFVFMLELFGNQRN